MSLFVWILLGLIAGFIASHLVNHRGEGMVLDVLLGIVGAILAVPVAAAIQIVILRVLAPAIRRSSAASALPPADAMAVESSAPLDASAAGRPVTET